MATQLEGQLQLELYRRSIKSKPLEQLQQEALQLAELALVLQPATIKWLLDQVMEHEKRQLQPVEDWHLALAEELLGGCPLESDHQA